MSAADWVVELLSVAKSAVDTAKTASRNQKSLAGDNHYGNKFHDQRTSLTAIESKLRRALKSVDCDLDGLRDALVTIKSSQGTSKSRIDAWKSLHAICETEIRPAIDGMLADPVPTSEQVLPVSVVAGTRGYIEKVVLQANGCYEHQWFDACSVMIRRLVETLIIEVYETVGRPRDIKDSSGNFLMLSGLVDRIMADSQIHLGRETKRGLPKIKSLGDRAAHNRHFIAKQPDIDKVTDDLRVIVDEFVARAKLRSDK